jgi:hypothetical protein
MASPAALDRDILPDNVKPVNYAISIFDLELGGEFTYQGSVGIQLKVTKSSKEITLNSHQLKIHSAELSVESTKTTQSFKATGISYDAPRQRATLTFPDDLPVSEKANLIIQFQGTLNNDMAGFYRSYVYFESFLLPSESLEFPEVPFWQLNYADLMTICHRPELFEKFWLHSPLSHANSQMFQ